MSGRATTALPLVLDASGIDGWTAALSRALEAASGLDDGERVDALAALERLGCVVTAAQAHLARELDDSQRAVQAAAGVPPARQGAGVAQQVALARRESPHRGRQHLGLAKVVARELPHTWAAWRTGRITEWKATIVARETACLSLADRLTVDEVVARDAAALEAMGERELAGACLREVARLDAAALVARRRRAESERRVTLRPAPDTMTYLTALLPVKDGVAALAALGRAADGARAAGDERTRGQVMADALVAGVCGAGAGGGDSAGSRAHVRARAGVPGPGHDRRGAVRRGRRRRPPRRLRPDPRRAGPRDRGRCLRAGRGGVAAPALHQPHHRRARRDGRPRTTLPRQPRALRPAPRPGLPDPVVRRTDPTHRPRTTPRRRRAHQHGERAGPVRGLQLRQGRPRLAGQTRPRTGPWRPPPRPATTSPPDHHRSPGSTSGTSRH